MKFVFASDSFKGSLTSAKICHLLESSARIAHPSAECVSLPIADGGEGTLDAIASVRAGERLTVRVHDGLGRFVLSEVLVCGAEAFVETAASCGLAMIDPEKRNPLIASSQGVGECIRFALDHGCKSITVGLGGSCTNDGGMGCLSELGVRFVDACGHDLAGSGSDLSRASLIDASGLHPAVADTHFTVMSDVTNGLLGPQGATHVFGRQKGADDAMVERLEAGMRHYAHAVETLWPDVDFDTPGFGAAGGLGMALSVFLGAQIKSGIEELLRWLDFDSVLKGADLVVTGEGRLDEQSLHGKVIDGIASHARKAGVPVVVVCGTSSVDESRLCALGITRVVETAAGQDLAFAMSHAEENYLGAVRDIWR